MGQTKAASEEEVTWDSDPYYLLSISVHKSRRYHAKLRSFYEGLNQSILAANSLLGAGAFMALIGGRNTGIAQAMIGLVAAGSALDSVFGWSKKAKLHDMLCQKFTELAAQIAESDANSENYKKFSANRLRIEKDEPPVKRLIDLQARNEELRSRGYPPEDLVPLDKYQRIFGYIASFNMAKLEEWQKFRSACVEEKLSSGSEGPTSPA